MLISFFIPSKDVESLALVFCETPSHNSTLLCVAPSMGLLAVTPQGNRQDGMKKIRACCRFLSFTARTNWFKSNAVIIL